jgi:hypothetical protein
MWRVAANILNKQLRTADEGWFSSLGFGRGVNNASQKKNTVLRNVHNCLRIGLIVWVKQINGKVASVSVLGTQVARTCIGQGHLRQWPGN